MVLQFMYGFKLWTVILKVNPFVQWTVWKLVTVALFYFIFTFRADSRHARMISAKEVHDDIVSLVTVRVLEFPRTNKQNKKRKKFPLLRFRLLGSEGHDFGGGKWKACLHFLRIDHSITNVRTAPQVK